VGGYSACTSTHVYRRAKKLGECDSVSAMPTRLKSHVSLILDLIHFRLEVIIVLTPISKKQLTTRLKLWGMRKNTKLRERVVIVQNYGGKMHQMTPDSSGLKVSKTKLERWQKEMKNIKITQNAIKRWEKGKSKSTNGDDMSPQAMWYSDLH
jgi:hypothetical protein